MEGHNTRRSKKNDLLLEKFISKFIPLLLNVRNEELLSNESEDSSETEYPGEIEVIPLRNFETRSSFAASKKLNIKLTSDPKRIKLEDPEPVPHPEPEPIPEPVRQPEPNERLLKDFEQTDSDPEDLSQSDVVGSWQDASYHENDDDVKQSHTKLELDVERKLYNLSKFNNMRGDPENFEDNASEEIVEFKRKKKKYFKPIKVYKKPKKNSKKAKTSVTIPIVKSEKTIEEESTWRDFFQEFDPNASTPFSSTNSSTMFFSSSLPLDRFVIKVEPKSDSCHSGSFSNCCTWNSPNMKEVNLEIDANAEQSEFYNLWDLNS